MIDKTISHYKILKKIGEGGMGIVYKAHDLKLDRFVALKFLPHQISIDDKNKKRFIHEAKAASALDHHNICTIHEIDETDTGQMFIVMAYYEGNTLKKIIDDCPLQLKKALEIVLQVSEGLHKSHVQGIIHRDLKPANIIINKDNMVKICDFGLAKLSGQTQLTREGTALGTVAYMSPEQARGNKVDNRTDIWSLGVVFYEIITGQLPFKGAYDQVVLYSIMNEDPEPVSGLCNDLPIEVEQIINRMLAKNTSERYQDVDEITGDLRNYKKKSESIKLTQPENKQDLLHKKQTHLFGNQETVVRSISQRLSRSSMGAFVGRKRELDLLIHAFNAPELPFIVAYMHGQGGIGKSFLLQNLIHKISPDASQAIFIDCRDTEPTSTGFVNRLKIALDIKSENPSLDDIFSHLFKIKHRMLLCLDQYENFILMDAWLRQVFVPGLPDNFLIVIASRYAPKTAWLTTPGWQDLFRELELQELSEDESTQMLETRNLTMVQIQKVMHFAHGHPLALELGAAALRSQPDLEIHAGPPAKIVTQLSQVLLSGLSPDMMEAVEAASTVRWTTEPILRSLLGVSDVRNIFDKLRELPFVFPTQDGLILHDVVHEAVSRDVSSRDPERYSLYRSRAWRFFSKESQEAHEHHLWHLTADMLYLIENPVVREAFFPKGSSDYFLQPATVDNHNDIVEIAQSEEPKEAAQQVEKWLAHHPDSFFVAKDPDGKVSGFYFCFEPQKVDDKLLSADPLTAAWSRHLEQNPVKPAERVLFLRRWLARETGDSFSPVQGACWIDIKQTYMEMRPHLRRMYTTVNDLSAYAPVVIPLCFAPLDDAHVELGGKMYYSALLDFGEESVDGWLKGLVKAEIGMD